MTATNLAVIIYFKGINDGIQQDRSFEEHKADGQHSRSHARIYYEERLFRIQMQEVSARTGM